MRITRSMEFTYKVPIRVSMRLTLELLTQTSGFSWVNSHCAMIPLFKLAQMSLRLLAFFALFILANAAPTSWGMGVLPRN